MTDRRIITPVLKYWGLDENPFEDVVIREENKEMFVGRENELLSIENSLSNRLTGIFGNYGVGKSSILWKLKIEKESPDLKFIYVPAGISHKKIFQEILSALLIHLIYSKIKLIKKSKIDVKLEFDRIEGEISSAGKFQFGAEAVIKTHKEVSDTKTKKQHNEETAYQLIREIFEDLKSPVVIMIDNLERLRFSGGNHDDYINFILDFAGTISETLSYRGIAFVISLDERFKEYYEKYKANSQSQPSFSFDRLIKINNFSAEYLIKIIKQRLKCVGFNKPISEFIDEDAFWRLYACTFGHARRSIKILQAAMEYVANKKKNKKIDLESIENSIELLDEHLDEKNIAIIKYLMEKESGSSSDEEFQSAVNLKRAQLAARLKLLASQINLTLESVTTGNTTKDVYKLPATNLDV